jgi:hypothetical protein
MFRMQHFLQGERHFPAIPKVFLFVGTVVFRVRNPRFFLYGFD